MLQISVSDKKSCFSAGSVVLESPVVPVKEGNNVTLRCRNKTKTSNLTADFYKDGFLIGNSYTGEMTIHKVSRSDEGLYKCKMFDTGESPESLLTVTGTNSDILNLKLRARINDNFRV